MRPLQPISHRTARLRGRLRPSSLLLLLLAACATVPLHGQDAPPSETDGSTAYTLHLYARLVELPTLIFIPGDKSPALDAQQINIKLNGAQPFHPTSIRLEGDDPLSIAVLIDVSGDQAKLISALQKEFAPWVNRSLRPQDHVSIFAVDCRIIQTSNDVPENASALQTGLDLALISPLSRGDSAQPSCGKSIRLTGSILFVMQKLSKLSGRRILLVVSSGRNGQANITWQQLETEAGIDSVTAFALSTHSPLESQGMRDLYSFTQHTGGLLYSPPTFSELPGLLDQIISQLRGRYILQFPMPHDKAAVAYHVVVTVPGFNAAILPSNIGVPFSTPPLENPSTELPSQAPPAPPQPTPTNATPNH
jgi:hypothetical protein